MPVKGSDFLATQEKALAGEGRGHGEATAVPQSESLVLWVWLPSLVGERESFLFVLAFQLSR